MEKIKVIHIITKLELGGAQRNTLYTVKNLDRSVFKVGLVSGTGGILDDEARDIRDIKFTTLPHLRRDINPFSDLVAFFEIYRVLRRENPDIVHTHSSKAGILGRLACALHNLSAPRQKSAKLIHTYHGFGFTPTQPAPVRTTFILVEKIAAWLSDALVFVSEANMSEAARLGIGSRRKHALIRSGVDISFFKNFVISSANAADTRKKYNIKPDEKVVLTIGPFKKQKNLGDFLRVAAEIKRRIVETKFIIVGDGELREELEKLAADYGIRESVNFVGWIKSKNELAKIFKISDVFLMTSLWEGLPRSIIEAVSAGVPVCANAVDGITDIIIDGATGLLAAPFDVKRAADNVEKILRDASLAARLTSAASKMIDEQFDINKMVKLQEELYKELAKKSDKK